MHLIKKYKKRAELDDARFIRKIIVLHENASGKYFAHQLAHSRGVFCVC